MRAVRTFAHGPGQPRIENILNSAKRRYVLTPIGAELKSLSRPGVSHSRRQLFANVAIAARGYGRRNKTVTAPGGGGTVRIRRPSKSKTKT